MASAFTRSGFCNAITAVVLTGCLSLLSGCRDDDASSALRSAGGGNAVSASGASGNQAPKISGAPGSTVVAGQRYTFVPVAADSDGDPLGFTIKNRPAWAQFDTASGRLTGTPTAADVGMFANIQISVTDGKSAATMTAFSLQVTATAAPTGAGGSGSVTLAWSPPTENIDGSQLTDLAGYRIRYGTSPDAMTQLITIGDVNVTTYSITNLSKATYFFAVQAFTQGGRESDLSGLASKTIT